MILILFFLSKLNVFPFVIDHKIVKWERANVVWVGKSKSFKNDFFERENICR